MGEVKQLSVGNLVLLLFGPVCAILVAIGLFLFFSLRSIDQKNEILEGQILNELTLNNEIEGNLRLEQHEISQYLREEDGAEWKQHEQIIYNLEKTNAAKWNDMLIPLTPLRRFLHAFASGLTSDKSPTFYRKMVLGASTG